VASPEDIRDACVDEDQALDFVQGHLSPAVVQRVDEHADRCISCRALINEAVRAFRERVTEAGLQPTPLTRFQTGDKLAGRYQVVRFIARGGMGEVYEADDLMLSTRIALKTLAATVSDDPQAIRRLKLEVNLARRITHPNVCRIFDIGVHESGGAGGGVLFITMELIDGISLGQQLREQGPLTAEAAYPIVEAMVAALGAAHKAGIIHRDFKSDNVMVAPPFHPGNPPRVVVMDFGLARASVPGLPSISTTFDSRSLVGTLAYMAPEQVQGKQVTTQTDIYALGVTMYEMTTGELPFVAESAIEAASLRLGVDPRAPSEIARGLDPRLEAVILKCLAREPEQRFTAVEEVAAALRRTMPHIPRVSLSKLQAKGKAAAKSGAKSGSRSGAKSGARASMPLWKLWPVAAGTAFLAGALVVAALMRKDAANPMPPVTNATTAVERSVPAAVTPPAAATPHATAPAIPAAMEPAPVPGVLPSVETPTPTSMAAKAPGTPPRRAKRRSASSPEPASATIQTPPAGEPEAVRSTTPDADPSPPRRSADPENGFIQP
jgi:serine/threonine protein kinase